MRIAVVALNRSEAITKEGQGTGVILFIGGSDKRSIRFRLMVNGVIHAWKNNRWHLEENWILLQ